MPKIYEFVLQLSFSAHLTLNVLMSQYWHKANFVQKPFSVALLRNPATGLPAPLSSSLSDHKESENFYMNGI